MGEDYLALDSTKWTVSKGPIIGHASKQEGNASQWAETPELCDTFWFRNMEIAAGDDLAAQFSAF